MYHIAIVMYVVDEGADSRMPNLDFRLSVAATQESGIGSCKK